MNALSFTAPSSSPSAPGFPRDRSRESEHLLRIALEHALERIADRELDAIRAAELRGERPTFGDVLEHYRATRFLYSAKLEQLGPRMAAVEETWNRLIVADGAVFKILLRHMIEDDRLVTGSSICAFEYAPSCWLVQHLVSARHHELTGTLAVCLGMASWVGRTSTDAALRFTYRDSNPGVAKLFGGFHDFLPDVCLETRRCAYTLLDPRHADPGVELPERGDDRRNRPSAGERGHRLLSAPRPSRRRPRAAPRRSTCAGARRALPASRARTSPPRARGLARRPGGRRGGVPRVVAGHQLLVLRERDRAARGRARAPGAGRPSDRQAPGLGSAARSHARERGPGGTAL